MELDFWMIKIQHREELKKSVVQSVMSFSFIFLTSKQVHKNWKQKLSTQKQN